MLLVARVPLTIRKDLLIFTLCYLKYSMMLKYSTSIYYVRKVKVHYSSVTKLLT